MSETVPSSVRGSVWSFSRGFVRSPGPIVAVSFELGTRPSSDSCGLGRYNNGERNKSVSPASERDT